MLRVRPLNEREILNKAMPIIRRNEAQQNVIEISTSPDIKYFAFDSIASEKIGQEEIFTNVGIQMA